MAQGTSKGLKTMHQSGGRKKGGLMRKGKREIAPKNKQRIDERAQKKVSLPLSRFPLLMACMTTVMKMRS
jgi:hypothetical protein